MPTAEEQAAAEKAVADKAAADKAAADKAAADEAAKAGKTPEQIAAEEAAKADQVRKDAEAKAAADAKAAEEAAKNAQAPEKYELKVPEGALVDVARLERLARANKFSNEAAQSALEIANALAIEQANEYLEETKADKTYGGEKLAESQQLAAAGLDKIAPKGTPHGDGLRALLQSGVGNNLYVMAALATVGRMTKEDGAVEGAPSGGDTKKKSIEERLYPNSPEFQKS